MEKIELFAPGPLGTCWYGKYHYMEPWVGCEHNCPYCYARGRKVTRASLEELGGTFKRPTLLLPPAQLLKAIEEGANSGNIHILKLCRYTDIFTPCFVEDGLAHEIIDVLAHSPIERIIITTKGVPEERTLKMMARFKEKFSYNVAVHPAALLPDALTCSFDSNLKSLDLRLEAAARIKEAGALTTVHLDPIVAGIDDDPRCLKPFLLKLKEYGLDRVMWSYLLLSGDISDDMREALGDDNWTALQSKYDLLGARQILPTQNDTVSYSTKESLYLESVERMVEALSDGDFQFVICSLKSVESLRNLKKYPKKMFCDGKFYA